MSELNVLVLEPDYTFRPIEVKEKGRPCCSALCGFMLSLEKTI
jgi:hypothetical protein